MPRFTYLLMAVVFFPLSPAVLQAQTPATASINGTVTDPTGAVIPGAKVELADAATNLRRATETNAAGQYVFAGIAPGIIYTLTITREGFRQWVMANLKVESAQSRLVNATLQVGAVTERVEVTGTAAVELQTADAAVGTVYGGETLLRLPTRNRSVTPLLLLQPLVTPGFDNVAGEIFGGQVAGARADQSTFLIDGGDATSDVEGTGGYNTRQSGTPQAFIPTPTESIQEFRVTTTNPNATFGRSQGGQAVMISKRGTNDLHGSAYWYHQNDNLSSNSWTNNFASLPKEEMKDNRWGFTLGGPVVAEKLFLYGHYEGRRWPRKAFTTRRVPTATLRAGQLVFPDATGVDRTYDLAAFDPRGIGTSPVMQAYFNAYPVGNFTGTGDLSNTIGFRGALDNTKNQDFAMVRLDYNITESWYFFASYRYHRQDISDLGQVDIAGLTCGGPAVCSAGSNPLEPRYVVGGFNTQLSPALTNEVRFSWGRHWWFWQRTAPRPLIAGTNMAIQATGESSGALLNDLINFNAQQARDRLWNGKDTYVADNFVWVKGKHTIQAGGSFRRNHIIHGRTDKVVLGLTSGPTAQITAGNFITIPPANRPPTCSATVTTNCLLSGDVGDWNVLYSAALGFINVATRVIVADKDFNPLPGAFFNMVNIDIDAWEFYAQDTWRPNPAWTITAGMTYQVQIPPEEASDRQSIPVFADTLEPVDFQSYVVSRREAALQGRIFNPLIAYTTPDRIQRLRRPTEIDWNNFGPRIALAWNPSFSDGPMASIFGDRKTVIRTGYSATFTRMNGVDLVMLPTTGPGLSTVVSCGGPDRTGTCTNTPQTPDTAFRIGVDGPGVTLPPAPSGKPLVPTVPFGELVTIAIDPGRKLGASHSLNLTWQRELTADLLVEVGYAGRLGRNLTQGVDLNTVPFFLRDPVSGQTLAQAFDAVALKLRAGEAPTAQPFFENMLFPGATALSAAFFTGDYINGALSIVAILHDLLGFTPENFVNMQSLVNAWSTDGGKSNYQAGFVTLRKRMSHGLQFDVNYTWSHSLDQEGLSQQWGSGQNTIFDFNANYAESLWDRRHTFNAVGLYELPFGRDRRFAPKNAVLNKVASGWWVASIFSAASGLPVCVEGGGDYGALGGLTCAYPTAAFVQPGNSVHSVVAGSGGIGTTGDPAIGGSGLNMFADPAAVFNSFRRPLISQDRRARPNHFLRGLPFWNWDFSIGKKTMVTEKVGITFSLDWLNFLNHPQFSSGSTSLTSPRNFGVIDSQFNLPRPEIQFGRIIQFGFRVEF